MHPADLGYFFITWTPPPAPPWGWTSADTSFGENVKKGNDKKRGGFVSEYFKNSSGKEVFS
jgi:hypothetical protein